MASKATVDINKVRTDEVLEVEFLEILRRFLGNLRGHGIGRTSVWT